ncbi:MAG: hypothetical protein KDD40_10960, partial [Bdellovibrionales bacterium]|nr:hypothetical protein [Bdellovibrionales bacterium]
MRLVIFLHLIFVITACSENKKWPSQQEQQYAPNTKTELGFIVSNVTTDEVADILEKYPHAKVRVIHPRQSIYEFYGLTEIQIHTDLPQVLTAKNQFFVPQNYDLQSPSENTDLQVDQCAN